MSLLYSVVFASRCRSNHHRLAVDALRHLKGPNAAQWRDLLLHYHDEYLKGAKAPDDVFKDFKNHVLHVRDNDWGGAVEACEEWYRRTVRALAAGDWKQAAWSAGVLSHYYVDPIQPFHTHQTEEESVIHRAVEWSFSKSYKTFQAILDAEHGGYPSMAPPTGDKWLADMVRAGAKASNPHYELIIEHYNLEKGVQDPPAGLDQEIRRVVAKLIGHAVIGLARILERAFEEAAVKPPNVGGNLQAFFLTLEIPIQAVLKAIDDVNARREVEAQYEEYRRTGKVRGTLGEDDKVVRALYAAEVLKAPLSSLDAKWPREIGAKAGKSGAAALKPAPKPRKEPAVPLELPIGAPRAKVDKSPPKFMLDGTAPVEKAPSIGPKTAKRLEAVGVRTIADLLSVSPEDATKEIGARHISAQVIRDWQAQALLACTVPGMKSREAQALVACGVRDAHELAQFDPTELTDAVARWGLSDEGARAWGAAAAPNEDDVATWIERAKRANTPSAKASAA
jgi:predicted flap endonuclease-1-like 5' DNA nuclease